MAGEIKTVSQLKAELKVELETRLKVVEGEIAKIKAGYSELKDYSQVKKRLSELERNVLLRSDVSKDQQGILHLK